MLMKSAGQMLHGGDCTKDVLEKRFFFSNELAGAGRLNGEVVQVRVQKFPKDEFEVISHWLVMPRKTNALTKDKTNNVQSVVL